VRAEAPHVAVMASGDEHLLSCFVLGSEGSLVSLAVLVPETIVALDDAVRRSDLSAARAAHDKIYPLARAIYGGPGGHRAAARLKACLHLLGRLPNALVRPPGTPLAPTEIGEIAALLSNFPAPAARGRASGAAQ
jgi:4-hydroxy-tetrahydrodipicolinate synthase